MFRARSEFFSEFVPKFSDRGEHSQRRFLLLAARNFHQDALRRSVVADLKLDRLSALIGGNDHMIVESAAGRECPCMAADGKAWLAGRVAMSKDVGRPADKRPLGW